MASSDMMQVEIVLTKADNAVISKLKKLPADITDMHSTMDAIGEAMAKFGEANIEDEGSLLGTAWKPLSEKYRTRKLKMYHVTHLLVATGKMKSSFAWNAFSDRVEVGNNEPYFAYHQSSAPRKKMPYRPMIGFTDDVKSQIRNRIRKDIQEKLRLANL